MVEESRIDAKSLDFSVSTGLSRDGQGRKTLQLDPGPQVNEEAWLTSIVALSSTDLANRLSITGRQARRIKTVKVGETRIREHAKRDRDQQKEGCRLRPRRARAALLLLAGASAKAA